MRLGHLSRLVASIGISKSVLIHGSTSSYAFSEVSLLKECDPCEAALDQVGWKSLAKNDFAISCDGKVELSA